MKRIGSFFLLSFVIVFLNYLLQKAFFNFTSYLSLITLFLVLIAFDLRLSNKTILIFAFFLGFINDSLSFSPLGLSSSSLVIMVFFIIKMRENFVFSKIKDKALLGMAGVLLKSFSDILLSSFFEYKISISYLNILLIKPFISFLLLALIFFFMTKETDDDF